MTNESPLVSVIMPVYNGERFVAQAIDSILTQTLTDFELLIVDDGSQDNSAAIIQSYQQRDSRIRFIQHERNMGQAVAQNTGIAATNGEYITYMDADDISLPERLQKQASFLQSHPNIGGVGTCRQIFNQDLSTLIYHSTLPEQHALIALNWFIGSISLGATLMLRREFLEAVGGYEPGLHDAQDLEFESRLFHQTSIKFAGLPEHLYTYRRHDNVRRKGPGTAMFAQNQEVRQRVLIWLWNEAPEASLGRLLALRQGKKLNWAKRRATKRDLLRLVESMIQAKWVEPSDRALLQTAVDRRLEQTCPRRWQQFCHWRRHHFGSPASQSNSA